MTLALWVHGKLEEKQYFPLIQEYARRINHYISFEIEEYVAPSRGAIRKTPQLLKEYEADQILKNLKTGDRLLLLDERGDLYNSKQLSQLFEKRMLGTDKRWVWVVGGPYGFSKRMYDRANDLLSLSPLTFPHDMARLIVCEQCYRAISILHNLPYHHE